MEPTTFSNYVERAMRTECGYAPVVKRLSVFGEGDVEEGVFRFGVDGIRLTHMSLGISNEIGELFFATDPLHVREEIGDLCWYCAGVASVYGLSFSEVWEHAEPLLEKTPEGPSVVASLAVEAAKIAEQVKKHVFYGKTANREIIIDAVIRVVWMAAYICKLSGVSFESVLSENIAKLRARFPDKFTESEAVDRDKAAEYKAMKEDRKDESGSSKAGV